MRIRLDTPVTTPMLPAVREAMLPFLGEADGLPALLHADGLRARRVLEEARAACASFVGAAHPDEILFTASGTEAINLALLGLAGSPHRRGRHVVLTCAEHPAVLNTIAFLESQGFTSTRVPVNAQGLADPAAVAEAVTEHTCLVCVHHANHDVGSIQPIAAIGSIAAERGVPLVLDATASAGWIPLDVRSLGASLVALAPHRFHGPRGVGVLYRRRSLPLVPLIRGGDQEAGLRAGSENVPAIVGTGVAAQAARAALQQDPAGVGALQRRLLEQILAQVPGVRLNGPPCGPERSPVNLHLTVEGAEGEGLVLMVDVKGVAIHSGAACVTRSSRLPASLAAIGCSPHEARCSVLLGPSRLTAAEEVERAVAVFADAVARLRELNS